MQPTSLFVTLLFSECIVCAVSFQGVSHQRNLRLISSRKHSRQRLFWRGEAKLNVGGFGLTDDGDFAILGVNMQDPDDDDDSMNAGHNIGGDISSLLEGTIFDGSTRNASTVGTANLQSIGTSSSQTINDGAQQKIQLSNQGITNGKVNFNIDEQAQAEIMEYLVEIMPVISEDEIEQYSIGLSNIGFHPKCVTMCELKLEDLDFMKVLHRRYFFNEVTGGEHPWEA